MACVPWNIECHLGTWTDSPPAFEPSRPQTPYGLGSEEEDVGPCAQIARIDRAAEKVYGTIGHQAIDAAGCSLAGGRTKVVVSAGPRLSMPQLGPFGGSTVLKQARSG